MNSLPAALLLTTTSDVFPDYVISFPARWRFPHNIAPYVQMVGRPSQANIDHVVGRPSQANIDHVVGRPSQANIDHYIAHAHPSGPGDLAVMSTGKVDNPCRNKFYVSMNS